MKNYLLKSVYLDKATCDILVSDGKFKRIAPSLTDESPNTEVVDCSGLAILPPFYNAHTHAAMTLLRGYADDMDLFKWLSEYIWPMEAKLSAKHIEIGTRLAILEMIKSGTVFFSDMYWHRKSIMKVVEEMGIRSTVGVLMLEGVPFQEDFESCFRSLEAHEGESERVKMAVMPHSVYTVGEDLMKRCAAMAKAENYVFHIHLSETENENRQCLEKYGCSPTEFLQRTGATETSLVAAHCCCLSENDRRILKDCGATVALNPCSNLKLSSGIPDIPALMNAGIKLSVGTDGTSSNNNLDMHEDMKLVALLAKVCPGGSAETLSAEQALYMATRGGALAYGIDGGIIEEGRLADALLVKMDNERMVPNYHLVSNWVYAADSRAIHSVMCNGEFVMRNGHVDGEEDIIREAKECAIALLG